LDRRIHIGKITSDFIWHMEDVLDLYEQPYDQSRPVICFDERPCQLLGDSIVPLPIKPGSTKKEHYEYLRTGTCCIFMAFEPRAGKRLTHVSERRTKVDYANFMKMISENYQDAKSIDMCLAHLNQHL